MATGDGRIRLVVADHHEATRAGIRLTLQPRGFVVAAEGEAAFPRSLVARVVAEFPARSVAQRRRSRRSALDSLTPRQLRVLALLAAGADTGEVGRTMVISPVTVRRHVSAIVERLGVDGRGAAVAAYRRAYKGGGRGGSRVHR